ncbi:SGNH/GDSL hydrolase family protein [Herbaspirillum lusitanum]|uniref:SGNH/GDSL hydrolase family protein n=1 Tax=Herbaspirillum lusitanum TaxID=213312 RepID=A0ABW9A731_9BURK
MRRWLPEVLALPLLPWLLVQGRRTRRVTPRMPEAAGAREGLCLPAGAKDAWPVIEVLAIGESPVAGVGVDTQDQAISARFAGQLAEQLQSAVRWTAFGKNGATVADALRDVTPQLPSRSIQIVLLAFGVNDSTAFHSSARYRRDLGLLMQTVRARLHPDLIIIAGVPPLHLFPALPQPLRHVLGMKAAVLNRAARQLAQQSSKTIFVPIRSDTRDRSLMAHDGYHPSAAGVHMWAAQLAQATLNAFEKSKTEANA